VSQKSYEIVKVRRNDFVHSNVDFLPFRRPWQASLCKHSEAFDAGLISGDTEYAVSNITFYYILALVNCGCNIKETSQSLHKFIKRALQ
jgi:hypothetical protein